MQRTFRIDTSEILGQRAVVTLFAPLVSIGVEADYGDQLHWLASRLI